MAIHKIFHPSTTTFFRAKGISTFYPNVPYCALPQIKNVTSCEKGTLEKSCKSF